MIGWIDDGSQLHSNATVKAANKLNPNKMVLTQLNDTYCPSFPPTGL